MRKKKVSITIHPDILEWIEKAKKEHRFGSRSHAFEFAMYKLITES